MFRDRLADYREAAPELSMVEAARAMRRGPRKVVWLNEVREEVGSGQVQWLATRLELLFQFNGLHGGPSGQGRRLFLTDTVHHGSHSYRMYAICRCCGKFYPRLFFKTEDWFCHKCHALPNRSRFISSIQRWTEEHTRLRHEIGAGRPFAMREEKYQGQLARMDELRIKLAGRREFPDPQFLRCIYADWSDGVGVA